MGAPILADSRQTKIAMRRLRRLRLGKGAPTSGLKRLACVAHAIEPPRAGCVGAAGDAQGLGLHRLAGRFKRARPILRVASSLNPKV